MNLTISGIIFWILGWGIVIGLVVFCFYKILKTPKEKGFNQD